MTGLCKKLKFSIPQDAERGVDLIGTGPWETKKDPSKIKSNL